MNILPLSRNKIFCDTGRVTEPDDNLPKRNYKWPWFVLAAVILFVALAILWVALAAHRLKEERDFSAPLPSQTN